MTEEMLNLIHYFTCLGRVRSLVLQGHTGEVFVLEAHPMDPRILLSAGVCFGCFVCLFVCLYFFVCLFFFFCFFSVNS